MKREVSKIYNITVTELIREGIKKMIFISNCLPIKLNMMKNKVQK